MRKAAIAERPCRVIARGFTEHFQGGLAKGRGRDRDLGDLPRGFAIPAAKVGLVNDGNQPVSLTEAVQGRHSE